MLLDRNSIIEPVDETAHVVSMMRFEHRDKLAGLLGEELEPIIREVTNPADRVE